MIILRISGGLGNQMFQYSLYLNLINLYGKEQVKIDISDYNRFHAHTGYSLKKYFGIDIPIAEKKEIKRIYSGIYYGNKYSNTSPRIREIIDRFNVYRKKWNSLFSKKRHNLITDFRHNVFNDAVFSLNTERDWYLEGYWQNISYFRLDKSILQKAFKFNIELNELDQSILDEIKSTESVAVHVRRGDYIKSGFDLCNIQYYKSAFEYIEQYVNNPKYYFFSDDIEYVKDCFSFLGNKRIVVHSTEECNIDLYMMTRCKHSIIPNSTFSFWGAYLKENTDAVIIAPKYWLRDAIASYQINLPADWVIIDNLQR